MANIIETKTALAKTPETTSLQSMIESSARELGRALPEHMRPERLVRIALTCVRLNPDLGRCTPQSFLGALFTAAQLGLEPVAGRAYILPYNNNRKQPDGSWKSIKEAQFMIGYKGVAELFYRHEKAVQLNWAAVHEKDEFDYQYGTDAYLKHKPAMKDRGPVIAFWVGAALQNGGKPFMVMSKDDCMEHGKKHSKTYQKATNQKPAGFAPSSPWFTNPDAMCLKTVLIQLAKLLPLSVELQRAIEADETSREFRSGIENVLDIPATNTWEEPLDATALPAADEPPINTKNDTEIPFGE